MVNPLRKPAWPAVALLALGCALRLWSLGGHSLWYDEGATLYVSEAPDLFAALAQDRHPPLSFLAFRAWVASVGEDDAALRLLPAILSCLSLWLFARLAIRWLPVNAARIALGLQATAPLLVWIAHEVRMYAFVEFGVLVAWTGLDCVLRGRRAGGFVLAWLGTMLAFGAHYYGGLIGFGLAGAGLVERLRGRTSTGSVALLFTAPALALAAWLPWLLTFVPQQLATGWGFQSRTSARELIELPIRFLVADVDVLPRSLYPVGYALGAVLLLGLGVFAIRAAIGRGGDLAPRIAALILGPVFGAVALGLVGPLSFGPRYLMPAQPAVAIAMAIGLASLRPALVRIPVAMVAVGGCLLLTLLHATGNRREDFRTATAELVAEWQPGEPVLVVTGTVEGFSEATVRHYLRGHPDIETALRPDTPAARLRHDLPGGTRIHVVYRDAVYAAPTLEALRRELTLVRSSPDRFRVAYLLFRSPGPEPR